MRKKKPKVIWEPLPGSQELFLSAPHRLVLYEGSRGPGKTDGLIMDYATEVGQGWGLGWRGILFRRTFPELDDVVTKSKKWLPKIFPGARFLASTKDYKWIFPDGEELLFRRITKEEDYNHYHGHEYPWIGFEELTTWPDEKPFEAMFSCNRSSYRHPKTEERIPLRIRATTNPHGIGHNWVKKKFIDPADPGETFLYNNMPTVRLFGSIYENPYLPPEYVKTIEGITDPNKKAAWLLGDWDIIAGGIFSDLWRREHHVIEPFSPPATWDYSRGFDWGSSKPSCVLWICRSNGEDYIKDGELYASRPGDIYVIRELYTMDKDNYNVGTRETAGQIAIRINDIEETDVLLSKRIIQPGPADSSIYTQESGFCIATQMSDEGVEWTRANKKPGSRINGWELIRQYLLSSIDMTEEGEYLSDGPRIYIFNCCKSLVRTLPLLPRDDVKPDDVDTNAEDHAADTLRYLLLANVSESSGRH